MLDLQWLNDIKCECGSGQGLNAVHSRWCPVYMAYLTDKYNKLVDERSATLISHPRWQEITNELSNVAGEIEEIKREARADSAGRPEELKKDDQIQDSLFILFPDTYIV